MLFVMQKLVFFPLPSTLSDAVAVRNFNSAIMRSDGLMLTHCDDFSLYHIGSYDTDSAAITPLTPVLYLASGVDAMKGG